MKETLPKLLTRDIGGGWYLPWIVAILMFLAVLAAPGADIAVRVQGQVLRGRPAGSAATGWLGSMWRR